MKKRRSDNEWLMNREMNESMNEGMNEYINE